MTEYDQLSSLSLTSVATALSRFSLPANRNLTQRISQRSQASRQASSSPADLSQHFVDRAPHASGDGRLVRYEFVKESPSEKYRTTI
jgi:hypothetical protein